MNMIYKMYIMTFKEAYKPMPEEEEFFKFYKEHGVEIVGEWVNTDNPKEAYFVSAYRDNEHYNSFVNAMKQNSEYNRLTEKLNSYRESVKVVNLKAEL